jgi:hypothetical protein
MMTGKIMMVLAMISCINYSCGELFMIVQYDTTGKVILNPANITIRTLELHVTVIGCDYGYYDYYLLYPPPNMTNHIELTPFECRECTCDWNRTSERTEQITTG